MLQAHGIKCVADVRRFPGSRKFPQFSSEALVKALANVGITYLPCPDLGGRRSPHPDSPNTRWRHKAFRAYADHMATEEYRAGRKKLIEIARRMPTTMLCSEAVWWRCHRSLIADDLKVSGATVIHIFSNTKTDEHPYTSAARIIDGMLSYCEGDK